MALGDAVAASNPANTQGVTNDMSFLVWAHNNAALTFSTVVTGLPNSTVHTPRIWKTDKTNWGDQNITVCAQGTAARYLLISSDATFGVGDTELALNAQGCVTFNSSLLSDGSFFTLATKITGPACVDTNIKMWLRADYGTVTETGASQWNDFSGVNNNVVQATATQQPGVLAAHANYNPALDFDGSNDVMASLARQRIPMLMCLLFPHRICCMPGHCFRKEIIPPANI
jgi:hypothetical protein